MVEAQLNQYRKSLDSLEGEPEVIELVREELLRLVGELEKLPSQAAIGEILICFKKAVFRINELADDIMTEERESILGAMYELAEIVGVSGFGDFLEDWRGDW